MNHVILYLRRNIVIMTFYVIITMFMSALLLAQTSFVQIPDGITNPAILVCASLIISLSSRNVNIGERARNNSRQLIYPTAGLESKDQLLRNNNLREQNELFLERYTLNQFALSLPFVSLGMFLCMACIRDNIFIKTAMFLLGVQLLVLGFILTLVDIYQSHRTLRLEVDLAEELSQERDLPRSTC